MINRVQSSKMLVHLLVIPTNSDGDTNKMKLNEMKCKNAKPLDPTSKAPLKLSDGQGLYLYVMPNGSKYWRFIYRFNGKQKMEAMGVYIVTNNSSGEENNETNNGKEI